MMALALSYMVQNHSQLISDITNLGKTLCNDKNDPMHLQRRIRKILKGLGKSQQIYDKLRADFQSILNEEPYSGQCSAFLNNRLVRLLRKQYPLLPLDYQSNFRDVTQSSVQKNCIEI